MNSYVHGNLPSLCNTHLTETKNKHPRMNRNVVLRVKPRYFESFIVEYSNPAFIPQMLLHCYNLVQYKFAPKSCIMRVPVSVTSCLYTDT